jgi:tetratricopeptide (TPR) repeat protein
MNRILVNGTLVLLLMGALTLSAFAQIPWKGNEYPGYIALFNEKDPAKQAALAEKYLADHKDAAPEILTQTYQFMLFGYANSGNWPRTLESVERMAVAPKLTDAEKQQYTQIGMLAAANTNNTLKLKEYAEKVLKDNPKDFKALVALSGVLYQTVPTGAEKDAHIARTLQVTKDALALGRPEGLTDAQFNPIALQLRETTCLMLLNQKEYEESIAECHEALKLNPKDAFAWYWIGLAHSAALNDLVTNYTDAVANYNKNRDKGQLVVDELKAAMQGANKVATDKRDEAIDAFIRAVVIDGDAGKQAMAELQKIYLGTPDELNRLIEEKKKAFGI